MPLVVAQLQAELAAVFLAQPDSGAKSAKDMAAAYDNYCKAGLAGGAVPVFTATEVKRLEGLLAGALADPKVGSAANLAMAWMNGLNSYWLAPPVQFATPPILGMVTAIAGIGAVSGGLTGVFSNTQNTEASAAQQIATILDAATKTVLVTFTAPPAPLGPPPPATVV